MVLALLLIVAGVALAVWQPWRAAGGTTVTTPPPTTPASQPSASETAEVTPTPPASPSETPEGEPTEPDTSPTPEPSATLTMCASGDVTVSALTDKEVYRAGEKPKLSIRVVNDGDDDCVMDVGTATQSFVIVSGPDTWWRSTDCQKASNEQRVTLEPGRAVTSVTPLEWDRTRSSADTCGDDRPSAGAGWYNLIVEIGGIESEARQFELR